jgi:ABC-type transport system involved in cytochrome c biogenesis permease subunit
VDPDTLTSVSNLAFGLTLALYLAAAVGYFHVLAFRRRTVLTVARGLAYAGVAVHLTSVVARGLAAERVPWGNMYEYVTVVGLLLVVAFLVIERRWRVEAAGGFVLGGAVAAMLGSALFALGFVFTLLYLWQERQERREVPAALPARKPALVATGVGGDAGDHVPAEEPEAEVAPRRGRLPPSPVLDRIAYRTIVFAFPIWTLAVIFGAIWAEEAWGRYWGWDPKEVWSFVTWVAFAGYLHARATVGWRGRRAAVLAVIGFVALVFNLIVVNTVIAGLHSYAQ